MEPLQSALIGLAGNPAAPPEVLLRLAAQPLVAALVAWREDLSEPVLARLLAHQDQEVDFALSGSYPSPRTLAARRREIEWEIGNRDWILPRELELLGELTELARHRDPLVRAAVARSWAEMPDALRRELLTDPDEEVRELALARLAEHAVLTPVELRRCLDGAEELRERLARNPSLPRQARERLAADPSPWVRAQLVLRQDLPEPERARLHATLPEPQLEQPSWLAQRPLAERIAHLDSPVPGFRQAAAATGLPADQHPDVAVRRISARRPDCPGEVLARLLLEHGDDGEQPLLVQHPNFPIEALLELAGAADPHRRAWAAHHPAVPAEMLNRLAGDPAEVVRWRAAQQPRTPRQALAALLADDDPDVAAAAAGNPALPEAEMCGLLDRAGW